ncbi:MAG: hypothetical protein WDO14_20595 [Bacteroidota bacterium]
MIRSLLFVFTLISGAAFCQDKEGFVAVKNEPPIIVSERWVEFPNKKPTVISRELKSEFVVNASIYKVINLIWDESKVNDWQQRVNNYKIYRKADTTTWDEYSLRDIPWPLDDQDSYMEYKLSEVTPGKEYIVTFKSKVDDNIAPQKNGIHRIELIGSWKFVQIAPNVVRVVYRIQSAPATNAPRMIVDSVVRNNLLESIKSLTAIAEK